MTRPALAAVLLLATGCATPAPEGRDYGPFFAHHPRSIVVVPPFNRTTAVDAPLVFTTTVTRPLAERGYYVFPVALTAAVLEDLGLTDEGLVARTDPRRLKEVFGADAALYVTITSWVTTYVVVSSDVSVEATYRLVDTATAQVLWERTERASRGSGGGGNSWLEALLRAAVHAVVTDYRPLARQANDLAVSRARGGLPAGPYHPEYQKDVARYGR